MDFFDELRRKGDISFRGMRDAARLMVSELSVSEHESVFDSLCRGTAVLTDERQLNQYLCSFGAMHEAKLRHAFSFLETLMDIGHGNVEVLDWGCGQGTATMCLLDHLVMRGIRHKIRRVTLIDSSTLALSRARSVVEMHPGAADVDIRVVNKPLNSVEPEDIMCGNGTKLHLFSNILDMGCVDLTMLSLLLYGTMKGSNKFICVGPCHNPERLDAFVDAMQPDNVFCKEDKGKREWIEGKDWTLSVRVFDKEICKPETRQGILERVSQKQTRKQFFAGYILDEVAQALAETEKPHAVEQLLRSVSAFDVRSNKPFDSGGATDPRWATLSNILTRGCPTIAPISLQECFADLLKTSKKPKDADVTIRYVGNGSISSQGAFEALHLIDPRFSPKDYNFRLLESDFERDFIGDMLAGSEAEYLIQLLEPQRELTSIVNLPYKNLVRDQRVDFSFESPIHAGDSKENNFIIEIDGEPYHQGFCAKRKDAKRDALAAENDWETYRLTDSNIRGFVKGWESDAHSAAYLETIKKNYHKKIDGLWALELQAVLTPFAVARVEKVLIEAALSGLLPVDGDKWRIIAYERDVPCAALAIDDLKERYSRLSRLDDAASPLPEIELTVIPSDEFANSPLHLGADVRRQAGDANYDLSIDISMLMRDRLDSKALPARARVSVTVRSSHHAAMRQSVRSSESVRYKPLVEMDGKGAYVTLAKPAEALTYFLRDIFRKRSFRAGQLPILSRAMSGQSTVGLLPTGGGKSLTYQLAALMQPGVTIVVDPLISLMADQYRGLRDIRIDACAFISSRQNIAEKNDILRRFANGELLFLFISPERFMMENFRRSLLMMSEQNDINFSYGVIDEVHCVSEWGHDFRPSYLHLGRNMVNFMRTMSGKPVPLIGLTATASFDVLADVERELTLGGRVSLDSNAIVRPETDNRPELTYRVVEVKADVDTGSDHVFHGSDYDLKKCLATGKLKRINKLLRQIPGDIALQNAHNAESEDTRDCCIKDFSAENFYCQDDQGCYPNAGIIFCPHAKGSFGVNDAESKKPECDITPGLVSWLRGANMGAFVIGSFVGGDDPSGDMTSFNRNHQNIMVATKAFGMGIDKPNVRFTVNLSHPGSIESFVQEAGRAGRDRKTAIAYLLYDRTDYISFSHDIVEELQGRFALPQMEEWIGQIVLADDFGEFCGRYHIDSAKAEEILEYCRGKHYVENVDKNIQLYFHNNSFRGVRKEKLVLKEFVDNIVNEPPTNLKVIQGRLRKLIGDDDVTLRLSENRNTQKHGIAASGAGGMQYGFLFLDSLYVTYKHSQAEAKESVMVMGGLRKILEESVDHSGPWLKELAPEYALPSKGIYSELEDVRTGDYVKIVVSWKNGLHGDVERDKSDTDKAIYRMCCMGLVDDVLIDYLSETYTLKVIKKSDDDYKQCMLQFYEKYFSKEQAAKRVKDIEGLKGRNFIDKCFGSLVDFVYNNLEKKRLRAIEDVRSACESAIGNPDDGWLKNFIHLYFNSKYARDGYTIDGEPYSLNVDTDGNKGGYGIVEKYTSAVSFDMSGSEVDNVKHLYGATLLCLRSFPQNPALNLLRTFCIVFLGVGSNENLKREARLGYTDGFAALPESGMTFSDVITAVDSFNALLSNCARDEFVNSAILAEADSEVRLIILRDCLSKFSDKYCN